MDAIPRMPNYATRCWKDPCSYRRQSSTIVVRADLQFLVIILHKRSYRHGTIYLTSQWCDPFHFAKRFFFKIEQFFFADLSLVFCVFSGFAPLYWCTVFFQLCGGDHNSLSTVQYPTDTPHFENGEPRLMELVS